MSSTASPRQHDIVVYGATGFVGRLLAADLAEHAPAGTRIALAGRSRKRLSSTRDALPAAAQGWPLIVADASRTDEMQALAASARVVVTTVGPYARYGLPLAMACAAAGTDYADLTGEVLYVRDLAEACHEAAALSGARLVTSCGFDSVPSDLAAWMLHRRARIDGAGGLGDTTLLVTRMRGGVSGGTVDSMRAQLEAVAADPTRRSVVLDPFGLSPDRAADPSKPDTVTHRDLMVPFRDERTGQWTAPFVMAPYNTRIVRRSDALLGHAYGLRFRYREAMAFGTGPRARATAYGLTAGLGLGMAAMSNGVTRSLADRLLPAPGDGPDEEARRTGRFRTETRTTTDTGRRYVATVAAQGDPGYAATAVMLGESTLSLALDPRASGGGVLTPAVALGGALVDRLRSRGFTMSVDTE
ncbi:saccharopine dehydrogenase NADP-binding domain-containing protein [Dermatophilaceae bacterium Soc4.6]